MVWFRPLTVLWTLSGIALAGDLNGTIVIQRKLTHHNVTAPAGIYQRGPAVALSPDTEQDPISFERSHVAVYIENGPKGGKTIQATMEQKDREFTPDLLATPAGSA